MNEGTTHNATPIKREVDYPACFHFRIITDTESHAESALIQAVSPFQVTDPLVPVRASSSGRYTAFSVSARMTNREEMELFDAAIKQVPGVRIVL